MKIQQISEDNLKHYVLSICRNIAASNWRPDYVVGITRGGLLPAVLISQFFNVQCHTLKISFSEGNHCETNTWMPEDATGGRNILIVDDINDSGRTLNWLVDDWEATASNADCDAEWEDIWLNNVRFAVVLNKHSSDFKFKPNYCGRKVSKADEDIWWEFPWENWWAK